MIAKIPDTYRLDPDATIDQLRVNAKTTSTQRNIVMDNTRQKISAGIDGYSLGTQINQSINSGHWQNTGNESARIAGGWTGAWAFGEMGSSVGAAAGLITGPFAPMMVPALALIGGLGGGIAGYWMGGRAGQNIYNYSHGN